MHRTWPLDLGFFFAFFSFNIRVFLSFVWRRPRCFVSDGLEEHVHLVREFLRDDQSIKTCDRSAKNSPSIERTEWFESELVRDLTLDHTPVRPRGRRRTCVVINRCRKCVCVFVRSFRRFVFVQTVWLSFEGRCYTYLSRSRSRCRAVHQTLSSLRAIVSFRRVMSLLLLCILHAWRLCSRSSS